MTMWRDLQEDFGSFMRFAVTGTATTLLASAGYWWLEDSLPVWLATAVVTLVTTLIATELHGRYAFRRDHTGWSSHLQSGLTVAGSYVITTGALLVLGALVTDPSVLAEQTVYIAASIVAGIARYLVLAHITFAEPAPAAVAEPVRAAFAEPVRAAFAEPVAAHERALAA